MFLTVGGVKRKGVFSLGGGSKDRSAVLYEVETPSIIPHVAQEKQEKFPYEYIFRSIIHLLMDTVSSEYLFDSEFFRELDQKDLFTTIFDKIIEIYVVLSLLLWL